MRIDIKENKQEKDNNRAITEAASSIILEADLSVICKDVITKRQNPSRVAEVFSICDETLFAITAN